MWNSLGLGSTSFEAGRFDAERLLEMARKYGSKGVQELLARTLLPAHARSYNKT